MTGQTSFLQALGWAVINSLWQLALLWVIYQIITSIHKTARPSAKSLLAASFLMFGFAWFIYTFILALQTENPATIIAGGIITAPDSNYVPEKMARLLPVASGVYLALLIIPFLRFIKNYRYVQVIRNHGLSKIDAGWRLFVNTMSSRMGIKKPVHVWVSEWVTSPVTIGWLKPVILVPLAAINNLNAQQMEAVLLHELSHIRRYDYLLNLVINFIRVILYFNPFAKAFVRIVETEREKSCDEMVLQFQYSSYEYASALLTLEKVSRNYQLLMIGAGGNGKKLLQRVESIMGVQQKQKFSLQRFSLVLASVIFIIAINLFLSVQHFAGSGPKVFSRPLAVTSNTVKDMTAPEVINEFPPETYQSISAAGVKAVPVQHPAEREMPGKLMTVPAIINASFDFAEPVAPLDEAEEAIVKEAVESSRKVIESTEWRAIEKNLAEVFNEKEKEALKAAFRKEVSKFDWNQWENKLRLAYDRVNWDKVNIQLYDALNKLKTDSLVKVYNEAMVNLNIAKKELAQLSLKGIPDSDISLKSLADKQKQLQREVQRLKVNRNKKIVHL